MRVHVERDWPTLPGMTLPASSLSFNASMSTMQYQSAQIMSELASNQETTGKRHFFYSLQYYPAGAERPSLSVPALSAWTNQRNRPLFKGFAATYKLDNPGQFSLDDLLNTLQGTNCEVVKSTCPATTITIFSARLASLREAATSSAN